MKIFKTYHIKSFGCVRRNLDAKRIKDFFDINQLQYAKKPEDADCIVIVSCGLSEQITTDTILYLKKIQELEAEIILYGCLPAMNPEIVASVFDGVIIGTKEIECFDEYIDLPIKFSSIKDANYTFDSTDKEEEKEIIQMHHIEKKNNSFIRNLKQAVPDYINRLLKFNQQDEELIEGIWGGIGFNPTFFTLRISEGCVGNCSYCTIRLAIGKIRSKPVEIIEKELEKAIKEKKYKINIVASDTGAYGLDIASTFPDVLKTILNKHNRISIEFIQDLHPVWLIRYKNELLEIIKTKRIKSILTAIQSGSSNVLRSMKRYDNTEKIIEILQQIKNVYPDIKLRTQIIVGFPGETEADFNKTIEMIQQVQFDEVDIFAYYEVKNAESTRLIPKIDETDIEKRMDKLISIINVPYRSCKSN